MQYLDADDYLLAEKVTEQAEFVVQHPEVDVVIGPTTMEFWSEQGVRHEQIAISGPHDYWAMLASWKLPQTGAPLWKRSAILDVGAGSVINPAVRSTSSISGYSSVGRNLRITLPEVPSIGSGATRLFASGTFQKCIGEGWRLNENWKSFCRARDS